MHKKTKKYNILKQVAYILKPVFLLVIMLIACTLQAQNDSIPTKSAGDSLHISALDSVLTANPSDSSKKVTDAKSNNNSSIKATINYSAKDSIKIDVIKQIVRMYRKAHVDYDQIVLDAAYIEIDWSKNLIFAKGRIDSTGRYVDRPVFQAEGEESEVDSMKYNFQSEKGLIYGVITQQGDGYIHGEKVKKNEEGEMFIETAKYTTCNLEDPHFQIQSEKMKMVPEKLVVSGPFHLIISDIPTPLGFAFGIFPIPKEHSSGIVQPNFRIQGNSTKGLGLVGGGYYWAINDYLGAKLTGDIFTNGSWRAELGTDYNWRYHFKGKMSVGFSNVFNGFDPEDRPEKNNYMFKWSHTESANKNTSLSANVQIQSAGYLNSNSVNFDNRLRNDFSSNIRYNIKRVGKTPFGLKFNFSQNQDSKGKMNFRVPDININMIRQQPFKKVKGTAGDYVKNFSFTYSGIFKNSFTNLDVPIYGQSIGGISNISGYEAVPDTYDLNFRNLKTMMLENGKFGYQHSTTIQNNFKALDKFNINPNLTYTETYFNKSLDYDYNYDTDSLLVTVNPGFNRMYNYQMGVNMNTVMYSYLAFKSLFGKQLPKMRNMLQPSIGYQYRPDFGVPKYNYYERIVSDSNYTYRTFSRYNNFSFDAPGTSTQNLITYSLVNNIEMKTVGSANEDSSVVKKPRNIKLLTYTIASSYNFTADSLKANALNMRAITKLLGFDIVYSSSHDFYQMANVDGSSVKVNRFYWENTEWYQPLRTTTANLTIGTNFNKKARKKELPSAMEEELTPAQQQELDYIRANPGDFVDFDVPWSARLSYNLSWSKPNRNPATVSSAIRANGDVSLSKNWKVSYNTTYNFKEGKLVTTTFGIIRDLHCWSMNIDWNVSLKSIQISISPKSSMLQALKLNYRPESYLY